MDTEAIDARLKEERGAGPDEEFMLFLRDVVNEAELPEETPPQVFLVSLYLEKVLEVFIADEPRTHVMKERITSGEDAFSAPSSEDELPRSVAEKALAIMEASKVENTPENVALAVGLCCYGAMGADNGTMAPSFRKLFVQSWFEAFGRILKK